MKKSNKFVVLNVFFPIILGTSIYYLLFPEVDFVKCIDNIVRGEFHLSGINMDSFILQLIRNYLMDMLWGYALVFALFWVIGNNTADLMKIFLIAFSFSMALEFLQLTPIAKGTFDVFDIFVEFWAEIFACFIIKNLLLWRKIK